MFDELFNFIRRQYPNHPDVIPLHAPVVGQLEKNHLTGCIDSTYVSSVGPAVSEFEAALCLTTGRAHAIATVNGTSALQLGLNTLGVGQGMEVLMQPLTFIATANAVHYCGASPVFVDIEADSLGICPQALHSWLESNAKIENGLCCNRVSGKRIAACLCMHTFGLPSRLQQLAEVCEEFNIQLLEDCAEALGSYYHNAHVGGFGRWGALSFNGNKIITTGGGGALFTDDEEFAQRARHLATTAKQPHRWESRHDAVGFNFRMPNVNAALGCAQLGRLPALLEDKRKLAAAYAELLAGSALRYVNEPDSGRANFWLNAVVCQSVEQRNQLLHASHEAGIQMRPVWELLSASKVYGDAICGPLPVARDMAERLVNLPSSARISIDD